MISHGMARPAGGGCRGTRRDIQEMTERRGFHVEHVKAGEHFRDEY
jgi:hypothetical protein